MKGDETDRYPIAGLHQRFQRRGASGAAARSLDTLVTLRWRHTLVVFRVCAVDMPLTNGAVSYRLTCRWTDGARP